MSDEIPASDGGVHFAGKGLAVIYITAPTRGEGLSLARRLVEERLLACANIIDGMTSLYWWDDQVQQESEVVVIAKTREDLVERVIRRVDELHSYECPCVVSWSISAANPPYADWLRSATLTGN